MAWHTVAWKGLVGQTADTDIPAVTDPIIAVQNNHFVLPTGRNLVWAHAGSATAIRARLASPTLRQIANPYLRPIDGSLQPPNNPNVALFDQQPLAIPPYEEIQSLFTSGVGSGTEPAVVVAGLSSGYNPWPQGRIYPLRATSTTAAVAYTWTQIALTWQDTIPTGMYTVLLSEHNSATGIAHRMTFSNQLDRPGLLSYANPTSRHPNTWNYGNLGTLGQFRSNDLPRFEVFCETTDAAHECYFWVVQTGPIS